MPPAPRRAWASALALASAGVLVGHVLGYGVADLFGTVVGVEHGHLDVMLDVTLPLATAAFVLAVLADPRRGGWKGSVSTARFALTQSVLYLAMESAEYVADGQVLAALLAPPVVAGFVAQLIIAVAIRAVVGGAQRLVRRITEPLRAVTHLGREALSPYRLAVLHGRTDAHLLGARAPPPPSRCSTAHR